MHNKQNSPPPNQTLISQNHIHQALSAFINAYPKLMVLTGAGISTSSGIPAYRDKNGTWKASEPTQHKTFMSESSARQRYWARALPGWETINTAEPTSAHYALHKLEQAGTVTQIVTQNVDRLHQKAGSLSTIDLHGRSDRVRCMNCDADYCRIDIHQQARSLNPNFAKVTAPAAPDGDAFLEMDFSGFNVPSCTKCSGILKPDVVYFGDNVPRSRVEAALSALEAADGLLVIGSSLMVYSGLRFCKKAHAWNKPIAILNQGKTRADDICTLKLDGDINQTLIDITQHLS